MKQAQNAKMGTQSEAVRAWHDRLVIEQYGVKEWNESTKQHNMVCARVLSRRNKMIPFDDDQAMRKIKMKEKLQAKLKERNSSGGCPEAQPM